MASRCHRMGVCIARILARERAGLAAGERDRMGACMARILAPATAQACRGRAM